MPDQSQSNDKARAQDFGWAMAKLAGIEAKIDGMTQLEKEKIDTLREFVNTRCGDITQNIEKLRVEFSGFLQRLSKLEEAVASLRDDASRGKTGTVQVWVTLVACLLSALLAGAGVIVIQGALR